MKYFPFLLSFLCFFFSQNEIIAQNTVKGTVCDSITNEKLIYATVKLSNLNDSLISGVITDEKGNFIITDISEGQFILSISYLSYLPKEIILNFKTINKNENLNEICLSINSLELNQVDITSNNIKTSVDKMEYRLDSLALITNSDGFQVLKNVPGLVINPRDETVKTIGEENVLVLVNYMFRPAESLKSIKPDEIERIEILKNTMAEYGVSTVVNVILKKQVNQGFKSLIGCEAESFLRDNSAKVKVEYGYEKLKFSVYYQIHSYGYENFNSTYRKNYDETDLFEYKSDEKDVKNRKYLIHNMNFNFEYFINSSTQFSISTDQNYSNDNTYKLLTANKYMNYIKYELNKLYFNSLNKIYKPNFALFFRKEFKPEQEFIIVGNYYTSSNILNTNIYDTIYNDFAIISDYRKELSEVKQIFYTTKVTYKQNFGNTKFKIGYDIYYLNLDKKFNLYQEQNFNYERTINSIYSTLIGSIKGIDFMTGIRLRNFNQATNDYSKTYFDWLPSLTLSKTIYNNTVELLAYRKITYPRYYHIINTQIYKDSMNIEDTNPYLKPMKLNRFELNHLFQKNDFYLQSGLYFSFTTDEFGQIVTVDDNNVRHKKYENSGNSFVYGINSTVRFSLSKKISINPSFNLFYLQQNSSFQPIVVSSIEYSFSVSPDFAISDNLYAGCEFYYSSKSYYLQGYYTMTPYFNIYAGISLFNDKGYLQLTINPIKQKIQDYEETNEFYCEMIDIKPTQSIYIKYSHTISRGKVIKRMTKETQKEQEL